MFRYECWKCPKWHELDKAEVFGAIRTGTARPGVMIRGKVFPLIPERLWYEIKALAFRRYNKRLTKGKR